MKFLTRVPLFLIKQFAGLLLLTLLMLVLTLLFPSILINNTTLPLTRPLLSLASIAVDWESGTWGASNESLWRKRIHLKLNSPCARLVDPYIDACLQDLDLEIVVDLMHRQLFVERLIIPSGHMKVDESTPQQPLNLAQSLEKFRASMANIGWRDVRISDLSILIIQEKSLVQALLHLNADSREKLDAMLSGNVVKQGKSSPVMASVKLRKTLKNDIEFQMVSSVGRLPYRWRFESSGRFDADSLEGKFDVQANHPWNGVVQMVAKDCAYQAHGDAQLFINATTECIIRVTPDRLADDSGQLWQHLFVANTKSANSVSIQVTAKTRLPRGNLKRLTSNIQALIEPEQKNSVELEANIGVNLAAAFPIQAKIKAKAPDFPKVVSRLKTTRWAIPAPFNQLDGAMTLQALASTDLSFKKMDIDFSILSDLASERQELAFSGKGAIYSKSLGRSKSQLFLDADIEFGRTELFLPRLDPFNFPQLLPDPNIVNSNSEKNSKDLDLQYRLRLVTRRGQPIRLRMTQFQMTVPIEMDLLLRSNQQAQGQISVSRFHSRLFRREADVRNVRITFPREGAPQVFAKVAVSFVNYDLTLQAFGLLSAPRFTVTSNPPLSENSAISLLFFGRTLEELSPGQGESLGNAKAALANGAISAASMYLLASTPIESIGFDPTLGQFSATMRLFDGTSLRVHSAREGWTEVGVRKRLGQSWVLNTQIERSPIDDRRSASTFIEWSRAY